MVLVWGSPAGKRVYSGIMNTWHHFRNIWWARSIAQCTKACNRWVVICWIFLQKLASVASVLLVWSVSCLCLKCLVFRFTYFHLKHTSHSLAPLCAALPLKTTPLPEAVYFSVLAKEEKLFCHKKCSASQNAHINLKIYTVLHPKSSFLSIQCHWKSPELLLVYNVMAQLAKIIKCSLHLFV